MKKLLLTIFFTSTFLSSIFAQSNCPTISVTSPSGIIPIGDSMTFTANLSGGSYDKISYEWIISSGTLTSGQNTSTITVATDADLAGQTITATVKIIGLPQECKNEASASGEIVSPPLNNGCILTRNTYYGKISWRDEKEILENVAFELKNDTSAVAYFIVRNKSKNRSQIIKLRETKVRKYLFDKFKIAKNRIKFIDGGEDEDEIQIVIVPKSMLSPQ